MRLAGGNATLEFHTPLPPCALMTPSSFGAMTLTAVASRPIRLSPGFLDSLLGIGRPAVNFVVRAKPRSAPCQ
jgi:hypothetical protein